MMSSVIILCQTVRCEEEGTGVWNRKWVIVGSAHQGQEVTQNRKMNFWCQKHLSLKVDEQQLEAAGSHSAVWTIQLKTLYLTFYRWFETLNDWLWSINLKQHERVSRFDKCLLRETGKLSPCWPLTPRFSQMEPRGWERRVSLSRWTWGQWWVQVKGAVKIHHWCY